MSRMALAQAGYPALATTGFEVPRRSLPYAYYDGARNTRRLKNWGLVNPGPNVSLQQTPELRSRARESIRNNPYAAAAKRTYLSNMIGTGIKAQWPSERVQKLWDAWMMEADADGQLDFYGLQSLLAGAEFESGECLVRLRARRPGDMLTVPLQLQLLEPDVLDNAQLTQNPGTGFEINQGIELDPIGRRVAYWMRRRHPGDAHLQTFADQTPVRVPAEDVLHIFEVQRPGQLRGVPRLATVLVLLHELDEYQDAELMRKKIAALFAGFITTDVSFAPNADLLAQSQTTKTEEHELTLEPGLLQHLDPGQNITFSEPADVGNNTDSFIKSQLRKFAAGLGLTYEQVANDLSGVNYTSMRSGLLEFRRNIERLQQQLICYQFAHKVARRWFLDARASGQLRRASNEVFLGLKWLSSGWQHVDPVRDENAAILAVQAGFESREDEVARRGKSIEEVDRENAAARDSMEDKELEYVTHQTTEPQPTGGGQPGGPEVEQASPGTTTRPQAQMPLFVAENDDGERVMLNDLGEWVAA